MQHRKAYLASLIIAILLPYRMAHAAPTILVSAIRVLDGEAPSYSVDLVPTTCQGGTQERFTDDLLAATVTNRRKGSITITRVRVAIARNPGEPRYRSQVVAPAQGGFIEGDGSAEIRLFLTDAEPTGKRLVRGALLPRELGVRTVTITFEGHDARGRRFATKAEVAISFDEVNRCGT